MTKNETRRKYREKNKDKINAAIRTDRKCNPEKYRAYDIKKYYDDPEKARKRAREYYHAHKAKRLDWLKTEGRLRKYGLTPAQYENMLTKQNNKCAICFALLSKPNIDHCHKTNKVRGVLCLPCNLRLGLVERSDFRSWYDAAQKYLGAGETT